MEAVRGLRLAHLHKGKLLDRSESAHVHPTGRLPFAQVIALGLDCTERHSAESVKK